MTLISKTTIKLNEFKNTLVSKTKQSVYKLDQRIKGIARPVVDLFARANKPLASPLSKNVVQKEKGEDCCSQLCLGGAR